MLPIGLPSECTTIVLAAGEASRFKGVIPKQHLELAGERLIDRIERQCRNQPGRYMVIMARGRPGVENISRGVIIEPQETTCGTILQTREYWGTSRTHFLMGDTYYTDATMQRILADGPTRFYSDGQDIFAIRLCAKHYTRFGACLTEADGRNRNRGRIWEAYRAWHGMTDWPIRPQARHRHIDFVADATQDFDTMDDYEQFLLGWSKNILYNPAAYHQDWRYTMMLAVTWVTRKMRQAAARWRVGK